MPDETEVAIRVRRGQHDRAKLRAAVEQVEALWIVEQREVVGVFLPRVEDEARIDVRVQGGNREGEVSPVLIGGEHRTRHAQPG